MTYDKKQLSALMADVDRAVAEIAQKHGLVDARVFDLDSAWPALSIKGAMATKGAA